jgi:PKD repeat protein
MKAIKNIKLTAWLLVFGVFTLSTACDEEEPTLGDPPSQEDAGFTFTTSSESDNILIFKANNSELDAIWDLDNGITARGAEVQASYPFKDTLTITLTVQSQGGSASSTQEIIIAEDDFSLIDNPLLALLTGGSSRTWYIDSTGADHFGVGPNPPGDLFPEFYSASPSEKSGGGMYDDRYTFTLNGFGFDMVTNGDVYVNPESAGKPPMTDTSAAPVGDFIAQFPNQLGESWSIEEGADTTITFSGDAFIGYYVGAHTYQIVELTDERLFVRCVDAQNSALSWYVGLKPLD